MVSDAELMKIAAEQRKNAYAPYSNFCVGAAVCTSQGEVFGGCNVENISYGLTLCAERNAIAAAVAAGHREFSALAVCGADRQVTMPCGACLQVLAEFGIPKILVGHPEDWQVFALTELLPYGFTKEQMK